MVDRSRILLTGSTGQVGTAFRSVIPGAMFLAREDLDLTDPRSISSVIVERKPSAVINCAAYTNVDKAEEEEDLATIVNGESVGELATICSELGIPFLTFSTDYVFDGTSGSGYIESDIPDPVNAYGRSKLEGERRALAADASTLVIRTSWVVSGTHDNFVSTMLHLAAQGTALRVVNDQRGRPTIAADLALRAWDALRSGATGVLHLANQGEATWFDLAEQAIATAGIEGNTIEPCTTSEFPRPAPRPANSVLDSERLDVLELDPLPPWEESLVPLVGSQMQRLGLNA
ncbi:MAG: dTDP-4-dehydrorhamnose reductase [Actinomycetota bacterium]